MTVVRFPTHLVYRPIQLFAILLLTALPAPAIADAATPRVALVIGNAAYMVGPLRNPVNDARLLTRTLQGLGFEVIERTDADQLAMKRAIQEFGKRLEAAGPAAVGLFYYAGHGLQIGGRNYLIPTTARIEREADVEIEAVSADWVLEQMYYARNRLNFVILDACRNNPFTRGFRALHRGLARMDAPTGTLIAYSTAPGEVAADGSGDHSPYAGALAKTMANTSGPVEQMFKQVRVAVLDATQGKQVPWEGSSLTGDFSFSAKARPGQPSPMPAPSGEPNTQSLEVAFWRSIENSISPTDFDAYLQQYPNGAFVRLAKIRMAILSQPVPEDGATNGADPCRRIIGRWAWFTGGVVSVATERNLGWKKSPLDPQPAMTGSWNCIDSEKGLYIFTWGHGFVDTLTLSGDGNRLSGTNQVGLKVSGIRMP